MSQFHFLRPWLLLLLLPLAGWLYWFYLSKRSKRTIDTLIAPHLRRALTLTNESAAGNSQPIMLLIAVYVLTVIAIAGPSWRLQSSPFLQDQSVTILVVKVTESMTNKDVQPSRLQRAVQKLEDFLALRDDAPHALVAYSGSAHLVMPITRDSEAILLFAKALAPELMPSPGDAAEDAYRTANRLIQSANQAGSIVWFSDSALQLDAATMNLPHTPPVYWLPITRDTLASQGRGIKIRETALTADDGDVASIASSVAKVWQSPNAEQGQKWRDDGFWLTPIIALLLLLWFRPGWIVQYAD